MAISFGTNILITMMNKIYIYIYSYVMRKKKKAFML